jgi:hypothetical protein
MIMERFRQKRAVLFLMLVVAVFFLFTSGCVGSKLKKRNNRVQITEQTDKPKTVQKSRASVPVYYDFGDVLIPGEMKVDSRATFIYQTAGFTSGVLSLTGRVEFNSLITFFENNMAKDNWRFLSSFKSPRSILLFQKQNRVCVIYLTDREYKVNVEIWVAPAVEDAVSGLLK